MITVIIPAYNRAYVLDRAIDSVINQTYNNWELLIVDDRSTDHTKSLVEGYRKKDNRISYLLNEFSQGPGGARNFGMSHALGQYIAFLDSDDLWFPNHLQDCISVLVNENVQICCGQWYLNISNITDKNYPREKNLSFAVYRLHPLKKDNYYIFDHSFCEFVSIHEFYFLQTSFLVFERSILEKSGNFDEQLRSDEDIDFFFRITMHRNVALINEIHGIYYEGEDNLYFFKDSEKINDSRILKKLNFNRKHHIHSLKIRVRMIKSGNDFIFKSLMLLSTYSNIRYTYGYLSDINKSNSPLLSFYYLLLKRFYSYKCYWNRGNRYFPYTYQYRFKEFLDYNGFKKIIYKSIFKISLLEASNILFACYVEDHVILSKTKDSLFLYNPANKKNLYLKGIQNKVLVDGLESNFVKIRLSDLWDLSLLRIIYKLYKNSMGRLIPISDSNSIVDFQNKDKIRKADVKSKLLMNENAVFPPELTFYVNDECEQECNYCKTAFCQHVHCTSANSGQELKFETIKNAIEEMSLYAKPIINIIGGNLFKYKELTMLRDFIFKTELTVNYYIHYLNINDCDELSLLNHLGSTIQVLVNLPSLAKKNDVEFNFSSGKNFRYKFFISQKREIKMVNRLCKDLDADIIDIIPFFNGLNKSLFDKHVFLSEKEIIDSIDASIINRKNSINQENFGRLYILPNGDIHTNMNEGAIGSIYSDSIIELIKDDAILNTDWYRVRNEVKPCAQCVINPFCPPISNYEYILGHKICKDVKVPSL